MNDADKKAFEAAFENYDQGSLANYDHVNYGWQAACEWRDSQVGEPLAYLVDPGAGSARDKLIFPWQLASTILTTKLDDRGGSVTPLYAQPNPPTAQINQQIVEALKPFAAFDLRGDNLGEREDSQPVYARDNTVLTVGDFKRAITALAAATQMRGDA